MRRFVGNREYDSCVCMAVHAQPHAAIGIRFPIAALSTPCLWQREGLNCSDPWTPAVNPRPFVICPFGLPTVDECVFDRIPLAGALHIFGQCATDAILPFLIWNVDVVDGLLACLGVGLRGGYSGLLGLSSSPKVVYGTAKPISLAMTFLPLSEDTIHFMKLSVAFLSLSEAFLFTPHWFS